MRSSSELIAITPGEPGGIGPDLVLQCAARGELTDCVVIADPDLLNHRASLLGVQVRLVDADAAVVTDGQLRIVPLTMGGGLQPGVADPDNAAYILDSLRAAVEGCERGQFAAMLTAPVNKASINAAGIAFSGHTEFLAELTGTPRVVMMLATPGLRVALVTTHLPLRAVADAITEHLLEEVIGILDASLRRYFCANTSPRILVCGLLTPMQARVVIWAARNSM